MRILYVSTHPHLNLAAPSGPGTHMREIIRSFEKAGHEVIPFIAGGMTLETHSSSIQFAQRNWKKWVPRFVWNSLKEMRLILHNRKMRAVLENLVAEKHPDLVYERGYAFMTAACEVAHRMGIKCVCEINAPYPEEIAEMNGKGFFHSFAERSEKTQVSLSSFVVVVSSAMRDYFVQKHGVLSSKIIVTPNAVDPAFAGVNEDTVKTLRKRWRIGEEETVIGFVGSIFPYHGVDKLVDAFSRCYAAGLGKLRLLVVGDGEVLPELRVQADRMNIRDAVVFTGNVPHNEVSAYLSLMDVTVMAKSNWYGSPVKIFEYGLLGKFVIAPDTSPVRDVMIHGEDGWLLKERENPEEALLYFCRNREQAEIQAIRFQKKILMNHTWQHMGEKILRAVQ